ncbi:MAG: hypothetical protein LBQ83_00160 [Candidatus Margulisbacteria bacterium]|jgi:hypothetical protein|nr:hypothetical protein [Candidatus Margulisiibacteriota bacterium]
MKNEPLEMQEIHAIREQIYNETKYLTLEQRMALTKKEAQEMIDKYHLKIQRL